MQALKWSCTEYLAPELARSFPLKGEKARQLRKLELSTNRCTIAFPAPAVLACTCISQSGTLGHWQHCTTGTEALSVMLPFKTSLSPVHAAPTLRIRPLLAAPVSALPRDYMASSSRVCGKSAPSSPLAPQTTTEGWLLSRDAWCLTSSQAYRKGKPAHESVRQGAEYTDRREAKPARSSAEGGGGG